MSKVSISEYNNRLRLPLELKVEWAVQVILEYYLHHKGQVYLTFSGGKDSQVVLEIIKRMFSGEFKKYFKDRPYDFGLDPENCMIYGNIPYFFADTGLEKPEIRRHARSFEGVEVGRPSKKFNEVILSEGVAVGSKRHARAIREINWDYTENNLTTRTFTLTGIMPSGKKTQSKLPKKFYHLIDKERVKDIIEDNLKLENPNPGIHLLDPEEFGTLPTFKISDKCCDYFKKEPFHKYERETGRKPITGTQAIESSQRRLSYLNTGCNTFSGGKSMSRPLSIWTPRDVWDFHDKYKIRFAPCYYDSSTEYKGQAVHVEASEREGCMFCLFGVEIEEAMKKRGEISMNRFEKLAVTHPRQHEYLMKDLGFEEVCDSIGVSHTPKEVL